MLIYPSIDDLIKRVDNKYGLVILAAKRARELQDMEVAGGEESRIKPVTRALEEVNAGIIAYYQASEG